ncbi:hypothetical protein [uncultured Nostoc sp.]|uniref:hypothetical protein n=1 Tax=uncultured Nostoc sp. TaxID=340711 RepID=UPI0035C9BA54
MSSYEDIRILTHIIGSFGQTCVSVGDVYDGLCAVARSSTIIHDAMCTTGFALSLDF